MPDSLNALSLGINWGFTSMGLTSSVEDLGPGACEQIGLLDRRSGCVRGEWLPPESAFAGALYSGIANVVEVQRAGGGNLVSRGPLRVAPPQGPLLRGAPAPAGVGPPGPV